MSSELTVLIVNVCIVLAITICTVVGMIYDTTGWGFSYLLLFGLMSTKRGNDHEQ